MSLCVPSQVIIPNTQISSHSRNLSLTGPIQTLSVLRSKVLILLHFTATLSNNGRFFFFYWKQRKLYIRSTIICQFPYAKVLQEFMKILGDMCYRIFCHLNGFRGSNNGRRKGPEMLISLHIHKIMRRETRYALLDSLYLS